MNVEIVEVIGGLTIVIALMKNIYVIIIYV